MPTPFPFHPKVFNNFSNESMFYRETISAIYQANGVSSKHKNLPDVASRVAASNFKK